MNLEQLFTWCKFSKRYQGYHLFRECLQITLSDENTLLYLTAIYMDAGKKSSHTWKQVERNIRTMLDYAWKAGGREQMEMLAGCPLQQKPTVGEVLEIFTCYVKSHPEIICQ